MMRAATAESSASKPDNFFRQSIASIKTGSSSRRVRSASVSVNNLGSGVSSWGILSSSSAIGFPRCKQMRGQFSPMLTQREHAVERNAGKFARAVIYGNAIHNVARGEIVERPEQMLGCNAEHRRADANA